MTAPQAPDPLRRALLLGGSAELLAACSSAAPRRAVATTAPRTAGPTSTSSPTSAAAIPSAPATPATPAEIAARATVPVLCYHQLRDWTAADGAYSRGSLVCPPANFRAQLDAVAADGWTTISPDTYLDHLLTGAALPPKPVLLTFDDSQGSQITEALPQLQARGMTATFFVMTVVLDKPRWMSRAAVAHLHEAGMTVAAHTWDHHRADRYRPADWQVQLDAPRALLEQITGAPVVHFAYPYGAWAPADFGPLAAAGYRTAFQLADHPLDQGTPLYTLRRTLVTSTWDGPGVLAALAHAPGR